MAKLKMKKTKDITSDAVSVFVNSFINKVLVNLEKKSKLYSVGIPLLIYLFGGSILKSIKIVNAEYITVNSLEKAVRNFTKDSNIEMFKNFAPSIQGSEQELLEQIQAEEEFLTIQESFNDSSNLVEIGDNVELDVYDDEDDEE